MAIKFCSTTNEFIEKYYYTDIRSIIFKNIKNIDEDILDDITNFVCQRLLHNKRVEKFDSTKSSFSTYMFMCIRSLSYTFMHKTKNDVLNRNCRSLSETVFADGRDNMLIDFIPTPYDKASENLDFKMVCERLFDKYGKKKHMTKIPTLRHEDLLEALLLGFPPKDIAELFNMTIAGVCASRKVIRKDFLELDNRGN